MVASARTSSAAGTSAESGIYLPKYGADGEFGAETEAAVRVFQADEGLEVDGKYGEKSHAVLMDATETDDEGTSEQPEQPEGATGASDTRSPSVPP